MDLEVGSPGSLNEFTANHPQLESSEVLRAWEEQLIEHRGALAKSLGTTLEGLHEYGFTGQVQAESLQTNQEMGAAS